MGTAEPLEIVDLGPLATYKARIKSGHLLEDQCQLQAILKLQKTFDSIKGYTPATQSNLLLKWLGMQKKMNAPKGLYIHGAVGGGKTMIMDLFHDTVQTNRKKRVHFNAFMLDIHRRIHALKDGFVRQSGSKNSRATNYDPIPPVASGIANESWLICFDEFQVIQFCTRAKIALQFNIVYLKGDGHWRCNDIEKTFYRTVFSWSDCCGY